MVDKYSHPGFVAAHLTLKNLHQQASHFKSELLRLQQSLDSLQSEFSQTHQSELIAANEQLVLSSIQAEQALQQAKNDVGELTRISQRDALTDTPNRTLMLDRIARAISYAHRHHRQLALIFLDLDNFKQINDQLGHQTGDEVLKLVTRRLNNVLRDSDTISRHGGDEFLILLSAIESDHTVATIAGKIIQTLAAPTIFMEQQVVIRASLGIAFYPTHGTTGLELIQAADNAMYQAKHRGGNCYSIHSNEPHIEQQSHHHSLHDGFDLDAVHKTSPLVSHPIRALTHRLPGRQRRY
ncbi:MAG: GGDEF domain-containing protein [Gammaproteobacteria bacterium]|nr:GGDEF domain-containing protein [Gammaproteobacteria bacterium]